MFSPILQRRFQRRLTGACATALVATMLSACALTAVPTPAKALAADSISELSQAGPFRRSPDSSSAFRQGQPITELTAEALYEFLLAEVALQRGQLGVATQAYLDLAKRSRDARVARRATEVAVHARMPNAAIEAARIWHESDLESDDALRALSSLLISANKLDDAEPYLQKTLARRKGDIGEGLIQLGQFLASNADKPAVLRLVKRLAEPHGDSAGAHLAIAQAALAANDDTLARAEAQKAGQLRTGWEQAALVEAAVLQKQSNTAALGFMRDFLSANPKSLAVRGAYARILVAERDLPVAREQFKILADENRGNVDVLYEVALLSMQIEDWSIAETQLKQLLTMPFRDRELLQLHLGQISEEQKRYDEALTRYRDIQKGEHLLTAQIRQSAVIAKQGNLDGARTFLQQASPVNEQQRVQLVLAESQLLRDANKSDDAIGVLDRALEKLPNNPELLYDHAMLAEKLDRVAVMEASLRKVISVKPDHAHAYNALGYSLADRNMRLPEARELIEKAMKLAPEDLFIVDSMGWVLYRQGDLEGALAQLTRAYKGRPDAEIAAHLGEVLWQLGRRTEALKIWQEGAKKSPENEVLQKTMRRFQESTAVK
ncbi:MAG: tetratricopeptide repeat protein [Burkholderiales bacterium]